MALKDFLFGKKGGFEQIPTMSPEQQTLLNQLLGGLGGATGQGFGFLSSILGGGTEAFEKPLMRQFQESILPGIAERYAGVGGLSSGSFQQALGQAGAGLTEQLGALRGQLGMQGLSQLQGLLGQGLGAKPFQTYYQQGQPGFLQDILSALAGGGTQLGIGFLGGGLSNILNNMTFLGKRKSNLGLRPGEMYNPQYGYMSAG